MARYAYCLGVNKYADATIHPLSCAESDARELAGVLKHSLGYAAEYLEERKTDDVEGRIADLGQHLKPGDSFLFYFSGHGHQRDNDQLLLLPGVRYATLEAVSTAPGGVLSWQALKALTAGPGWEGVERIFILDACRSPIVVTKGANELPQFRGAAILRDPTPQRRSMQSGHPFTLLNSCDDGQCALELPGERPGPSLN